MRNTITLCLLFLLCNHLTAQFEEEKLRKLRVENGISEILVYQIDPVSEDSVIFTHNFYNRQGKVTKDMRFHGNGKIRFWYEMEYNSKGNIILQKGYKASGSLSTKLTYDYDKKGNLTDYKQLRSDGSLLKHQKKEYNKKGQNTSVLNRHPNGSYIADSKYFYREDGQYDRIKKFTQNEWVPSNITFAYDDDDKLIAKYGTIGKQRNLLEEYSYNEEGLVAEVKLPELLGGRGNNGMETRSGGKSVQYKYDTEGNLIEARTIENGQLVKWEKYCYKKFDVQ